MPWLWSWARHEHFPIELWDVSQFHVDVSNMVESGTNPVHCRIVWLCILLFTLLFAQLLLAAVLRVLEEMRHLTSLAASCAVDPLVDCWIRFVRIDGASLRSINHLIIEEA